MREARIVGAVSFDKLEETFVSALTERLGDQDQRIWVVTATNILGLHLLRRMAAERNCVLSVDFKTFHDVALHLGLPRVAAKGLRPLPSGAAELVLEVQLHRLDAKSYFGRFQDFANGARVVLHAIRLLKECGWSPEKLMATPSSLSERDAEVWDHFRQLADLWLAYEKFKDATGFFDGQDLLIEAARDGDPESCFDGPLPSVVFLYGFYDLTPLQREVVRRLTAQAARASAYLLWDDNNSRPRRGFEYAAGTVEFLKSVLGVAKVECIGQKEDGSDLAKLRRGIFERYPPEGSDANQSQPSMAQFDGSVTILNCPGEAPECEEVVREVLKAYGATPEIPKSVGVLARSVEDVADALREALARAGVAPYMREGLPLSGVLPGRMLLRLLELAESDGERSIVIEFLSVARMGWPEGLSPTALDRLSREAGIVKGWDSWAPQLKRHEETLLKMASKAEFESDKASFSEDAELCRVTVGFLGEFFGSVRRLGNLPTWQAVSDRLRELIAQYTSEGQEGRDETLDAIGSMATLDMTGAAPDISRVRRRLNGQLGSSNLWLGKFQQNGLTVSSIMASRGPTYDVVLAPRLLERSFPRRITPDPLLSERERILLCRMAAQLGAGELPLQRQRPEEERYLFRIVLASAKQAVILLYPRIEQDSGKARIPSRFVQQTCDALCGVMVQTDLIEKGTLGSLVKRVSLRRRAADIQALDRWEYDISVHASASVREAEAYTSDLSKFFVRAREADRTRWCQREYGPFDGKLVSPSLLDLLSQNYARFGAPISATQLEIYSKCPFEYFLRFVLGIKQLDRPAEELDLPAAEWGMMLHDFFAEVYRRKLKARRLKGMSDEEIEELIEWAGPVADEVGQSYVSSMQAAWLGAKDRLLRDLRLTLMTESGGDDDSAPEFFELSFGPGWRMGPFRLNVGGDRVVEFRGRIDRIDRRRDGSIRVVDYKSGKLKGYEENSFRGGRQLQLPLYLLTASQAFNAKSGNAQYFSVAEQKFLHEFSLADLEARREELRQVVSLILDGIENGEFFMLPDTTGDGVEYCQSYCEFTSICGHARRNLADIKRGGPSLGRLEKLRSIRE